jgi:hypothetical protein
VQSALEDHVFSRVNAPNATCGTVYSTDMDDGHENLCRICGDVGELIICDKPGCTFSFHLKCIGLRDVPEGDWFCNYCSTNPIDPNDGHHIYCVECGKEGNLIMCDAENCPRSYHFSCAGLSGDVLPTGDSLGPICHFKETSYPLTFSEDWFCPSHPFEHPSGVLLRLLSWELELRKVEVGSAHVQNKIQVLVKRLSKTEQNRLVQHITNHAYDPNDPNSLEFHLNQLLKDVNLSTPSTAFASSSSAAFERVSDQSQHALQQPVLQQPVLHLDLTQHRKKVGTHLSVYVTGALDGTVYGSSIYSDDSDMNTAAVHSGIVKVGESKQVTVVTKGPQKRYSRAFPAISQFSF